MTTPFKGEVRAGRARSLSRATAPPRARRVPLKLIHNVTMKRVDSAVARCAQVRCRHQPRAIAAGDYCPACDERRVEYNAVRSAMRCRGCGWSCALEAGDAP